MSNVIDRRDKPETEQYKLIDLSNFLSFSTSLIEQNLICLYNETEKKIILLAEVEKIENHPIFKTTHLSAVTEIERSVFQNIWGELLRLRGEPNLKIKDREPTAIQVALCCRMLLSGGRKEDVRRFRLVANEVFPEVLTIVSRFNGALSNNGSKHFWIVFKSLKDAIYCSAHLKEKLSDLLVEELHPEFSFRMGLSVVKKVVSENGGGSEINRSRRLCDTAGNKILISADLIELAKSEIPEVLAENNAYEVLSEEDEKFVNGLFDCVEKKWQDESFLVSDFSKQLSWSKSQIYRKMASLLGMSPNNFIKEYRLGKSLELLNLRNSNIAEVAFESGFSSPSYFTKCFQFRFGITPSDYLQIINEQEASLFY